MKTHDVLKPAKGAEQRVLAPAALAAMGLEAEFALVLDGQPAKPEDVFGSPTRIVRRTMMHRTGRSYHLPTGSAVYFDTGVIEIATPVIEIETACAARAGRSLWESIRFLRQELDAWEKRERHTVRLSGFSTHYNVSFERPVSARGAGESTARLARLLTEILPIPVMLLAANRRSTGIGVRPRTGRVEVTADFTPDAALMIAAATLIVGVTREVMTWPSFDVSAVADHDIPVVHPYTPERHSSRVGWVARHSSFAHNPFASDVNAAIWPTRDGRVTSLRAIAREITEYFWRSIEALGDPRSLRLISSVMRGDAKSLLELDDRPAAYDSIGHLCSWPNLFPVRALPRSRYERVFIRAISGHELQIERDWYTPTRMRGWSHVVFRRERDRTLHIFSLDFLLQHLDSWELGPAAETRIRRTLHDRLARRH